MLRYSLRVLLSLGIGAAGGLVFFLLKLPLPWMLGAMLFSLIAALARLPVVSTKQVRPPLAAIIGIALGSSFTPNAVAHFADWLELTLAVVLSTIAIGGAGYLYLRAVGRDSVTAYFAAAPGGLYEMTYQGGLAGGDEKTIALTQASRIFLVAFLVPMTFSFTGLVSTVSPTGAPFASYGLADAALLLFCYVGWPLAVLCRLPNPALIGPMFVSALFHVLELTSLAPPAPLIAAAQVVLGVTVGGNFLKATRREVLGSLLHGLPLFFIALAICGMVSAVVASAGHFPFPIVLLAIAPGGMTEMSLIALALGAEVVVVSTQHLVRVLLVQILGPLAFKAVRRSRGPQ